MPATDCDLVTDRLGELRAAYGARLPGQVDQLRAIACGLVPSAGWPETGPALEALRAASHMLAGSAATFGYAAVGQGARSLEGVVAPWIQRQCGLPPEAVAQIRSAIDAMGALVAHPRDALAPMRTLALIATTDEPGNGLVTQLHRDGWGVVHVRSRKDVAQAAMVPLAAALVQAEPDIHAAIDLLDGLRGAGHAGIPAVFLAVAGGFAARYAAAAAGGAGFLVDPLGMPDFAARLDALTAPTPFRPYRVLSLGTDGPELDPGVFIQRRLTDPPALLAQIADFQPELLLLSLQLDGFDAASLARMVWQEPAHRGIGIFFCTSDAAGRQAFLGSGVTDAYVVGPPVEAMATQSRMLSYLHDRRAGLRPANSHDLAPLLARVGRSPDRQWRPSGRDLVEKPRRKILIVDDDRYLVAALANALSDHGADVLRAYSGEEGFVTAWRDMPQVIITDVEMPNGTGDRMILQLRGNPRTRDIPVIVMTNRRWEDGRDYALEREMRGRLGAACYLQKPVTVETLVRELARL